MITGGQLLAFTVNAILGTCFPHVTNIWRYMIAFGMIPSIALFLGIFYLPESPRWLIMHNQTKQAMAVLQKIRPNQKICQHEINSIKNVLAKHREIRQANWHDLNRPWVRHLLLIGSCFGIMMQFIGINIMMYYGTSILMKTGLGHNTALLTNIGNGLASFIAVIIGMHFMGTVDRRKMLLTGIIGTTCSLFALTLTIALLAHSSLLPWIVISTTMAFLAFFQSSVSPTIWTLLSEIFPQSLRGLGAGISTFMLWLANFFVGFVFPILLNHWGGVATFSLFVAFNLLALIFTYLETPETQGKSLEEIQMEMRQNFRHSSF